MSRARLLVGVLSLLAVFCARAEDVKVTITVTVPKETDEKATLYVAGNLLGEWKADGAKLARQPDGTYKVELKLPNGQTLEYKINGGNWDTVEKGANGEEVDNRTLKIDGEKDEKITVKRWAKNPGTAAAAAPQEPMHTLSGDVRTHGKFASKVLGNERRVLVWLPPGYDVSPSTRYPVLYLHDGQNCFDGVTSYVGEWRADEIAGELIKAGKIKPIIMVAVAHAGLGRIDEYTPTPDASKGGRGELYAKFLIDEVKPFIDSHYRTIANREHTAVAGSSLGGLISLYLGFKHGDVFGMCGVISPSLWWDDRQLLKAIQADPAAMKREKLWVDIGTAESAERSGPSPVENVNALGATLQAAGMKRDTDFTVRIIDGAEHNEAAWSKRFGTVLEFFFKPTP